MKMNFEFKKNKMRHAFLILLVPTLFFFSCEKNEEQDLDIIELNSSFEIYNKSTVIVKNEGIKVQFLDVIEDSICRSTCIWEGRLLVVLLIKGEEYKISSLTHPSFDTDKNIVIDGYKISFIEIVNINPYDYGISLKIERN